MSASPIVLPVKSHDGLPLTVSALTNSLDSGLIVFVDAAILPVL
jgi:hypothetical protein